MQFTTTTIISLFASTAFAASSTFTSQTETLVTITSCASDVTSCPARNASTFTSTYVDAGMGSFGSYYAAGAAALAAGALLL